MNCNLSPPLKKEKNVFFTGLSFLFSTVYLLTSPQSISMASSGTGLLHVVNIGYVILWRVIFCSVFFALLLAGVLDLCCFSLWCDQCLHLHACIWCKPLTHSLSLYSLVLFSRMLISCIRATCPSSPPCPPSMLHLRGNMTDVATKARTTPTAGLTPPLPKNSCVPSGVASLTTAPSAPFSE